MRTVPRPARSIHQALDALLAEPLPPLVAGCPRNAHLRRHVGNRPPRFDPKAQRQSANRGKSGVSVHLSLLGSCGCVSSTTLPSGAQLIGGPGESTTFVVITTRARSRFRARTRARARARPTVRPQPGAPASRGPRSRRARRASPAGRRSRPAPPWPGAAPWASRASPLSTAGSPAGSPMAPNAAIAASRQRASPCRGRSRRQHGTAARTRRSATYQAAPTTTSGVGIIQARP